MIIEKIKPKSYDVKTSKRPKKKLKKKNQKIQSFKSIEIKQYIYIYIYNYAIEKYNRKKGIHDYSFSTIEIGQTIKCIAKNELKNSYVNQKIRRF